MTLLPHLKSAGMAKVTQLLNNYTIYYSKSETDRNRGVAFVVNQKMAKTVPGYNPINRRLIIIRFQCKLFNVTVIQVSAPTTNADDDAIEKFYQELEELIRIVLQNNIPIIMGDYNAKVREQSQNTVVMVNYGLSKANDRGYNLIKFCDEQKLVIINTIQEPQTAQIHVDITYRRYTKLD